MSWHWDSAVLLVFSRDGTILGGPPFFFDRMGQSHSSIFTRFMEGVPVGRMPSVCFTIFRNLKRLIFET